jgi:hypothetical protein
MVRVIFPSGLEVKYYDATGWTHDINNNFIKINKNSNWIASAPVECIVDLGHGDPTKMKQLELAVELIVKNARIIKQWDLKRLKRALANFRIYKGWKD